MIWAIKSEGNAEIPEIPQYYRPALLFHYCSVEALDGIVRSHVIWLSDSRLQNDHRENTWILGQINSLRDEFDYSLPHFQRLFQHFDLNAQTPYIAAFSTESDLLSQWRAYASDGTGVCVGIDPSMVGAKFAVPVTGLTTELTLGIHPVIYDNDYQIDVLRELLSRVGQNSELIMDHASEHVAVEALNLRKWACVFKNPAFDEEREWRLIHTPLVLSQEDQTHPKTVGAVSEIAFRTRNGSIVSYFELPLPSDEERSPIQSVILGPKCRQDEQTLRLFLESHGLGKVEVSRSRASYR